MLLTDEEIQRLRPSVKHMFKMFLRGFAIGIFPGGVWLAVTLKDNPAAMFVVIGLMICVAIIAEWVGSALARWII